MADLTTLAAVKEYFVGMTANADALLRRLITRESGHVQNYIQRTCPYAAFSDVILIGTGTASMMLPDTPVLRVSALSIDGRSIPAAASSTDFGYRLAKNVIYLNQGKFPNGSASVVASWEAGFAGTFTATVPSGNSPTITPSGADCEGGWAAIDRGVTYANGSALSSVSANVAAGQYSFADGVYSFNTSDAGQSVTAAFNYVPGPIEQAVIEMVGLDLKQRDNIGQKSKSLAGETISFEQGGLTLSVKQMLDPFRRRAPR